jgi:hypothetical protein
MTALKIGDRVKIKKECLYYFSERVLPSIDLSSTFTVAGLRASVNPSGMPLVIIKEFSTVASQHRFELVKMGHPLTKIFA